LKVAFAVALMGSVSSCASDEKGIAEPQDSANVSHGHSSTSAPSSAEAISMSIDPCEVLSSDDLAGYGKFESKEENLGGARSCFWQRSAEGGQDAAGFSLNVRDSQSIEAVNDVGGGVVTGEVNGCRVAVAANPNSGSCTVALKIDDNSRIDITITTPPDRDDDPCQFGEEVAYFVEPRLPAVP
jgi:hypothetical protein